jgi:Eukaryotic aspartyl protease
MLGPTVSILVAILFTLCQVDARKASVSRPKGSRNPLPLTVSSNVLTLTRQKSGNGRGAANLLGLAKLPSSKHVVELTSLAYGEEFATEITLGKEKFLAIVDTGSSDTWIVEKGFQCVDISTGANLTEASCSFGPTYTPSKTFVQTPNENFNILYASREYLTGLIGTEVVKLAGLKFKQTVGIVNNAAWIGDGVTSGIIGLAYPDL